VFFVCRAGKNQERPKKSRQVAMDRALESSLSTKPNVVGVLCADANGLLISGEIS
jgi:hypothetical protein